ncbi:Iron-sulfur clusters transporter atm1, mitochondrial [Serendipita sp. 399]|nr:Iron-sulfur clusters transporter atm1, mitochondrial [Serendipita sp. 399]
MSPVKPSTMTQTSPPTSPPAPVASAAGGAKTAIDLGGESAQKTNAEQRKADWKIVKNLAGNLWPAGWGPEARNTKGRVVLALTLLASGKLLNVQVPIFFKEIVDKLNLEFTADSTVWIVAGSLILSYGSARIFATLFSELRNAIFAKVGQAAVRSVARKTFEHLLDLDLRFHLTRQTGGLTRAIDRGTRRVHWQKNYISIIFHIVPTALEISLVCGILTYNFGANFAYITLITMAGYTWFTIRTTAWRTKFRRDANQADNKAATTAVDSLINYEAVKHFNNEKFEVGQYDKHLSKYEDASIKIATSLSYLNSGQNVIFSSALTAMMVLAAQGIISAKVHDAIQRLPHGYETTVGERGLMISGGEKQRLAIARVLLKDPPIVFFDEATSALDSHTETELMRNINSTLLNKKRTSIFIAHRLRTIVGADLIIVLNEGKVAEQGTHEELLAKNGLYHQMWTIQEKDASPLTENANEGK